MCVERVFLPSLSRVINDLGKDLPCSFLYSLPLSLSLSLVCVVRIRPFESSKRQKSDNILVLLVFTPFFPAPFPVSFLNSNWFYISTLRKKFVYMLEIFQISISTKALALNNKIKFRIHMKIKAIAKSRGNINAPSRSWRRQRYVYFNSSLTPLRA